jgi:hypothetical protein
MQLKDPFQQVSDPYSNTDIVPCSYRALMHEVTHTLPLHIQGPSPRHRASPVSVG